MSIAGLIMAAGGSSRMKTAKQFLPWGTTSLLEHVIHIAKQSQLDKLYVVLGYEAVRIQQQADLSGIHVIHNEQWEKGLSTSLSKGVQSLSKNQSIKACLFLLADQPFITSFYLNAMIRAYDPDTIIASDYDGRMGVPCLFPKRFFPELLELEGDRGAGKLLHRLRANIRTPDATADLRDIDTPEAYQKYRPR